MMLRAAIIVLLLQFGFLIHSFSQTTFYHRYVIEFTDKSNSPYSISNPESYLSQRAIERRNRYNIAINESDLPVNPSYVLQVAATGVTILNKSKWLNSITIQTDDSLALNAIRKLPFVKSGKEVALRKNPPVIIDKNYSVSDAILKNNSVNPAIYNTAYHQINMLRGTTLHENGFRGEGMIIAVFDGGWYNTLVYGEVVLDVFDSLYLENRVLGVWNFVNQSEDVYGYSTHGTEVLSAMAANKPGFQVGTAPKASYILFLTEDVGSEYPIEEHNWAVAAETADSLGADMISSSLGYSDFNDPVFNHTYADMDGRSNMSSIAANMAARKGMIVCSSAGNQGNHPWYYITAPADADSILTVGATDSSASITLFSSHGPTADGRVKPDVTALGIGAWIIDPAPQNNTTFPGNGTSFSNPIIAGITACLWQKHPDKSNIEVMNAIRQSAHLFNEPNDSFGYGIPNYELADLILSNRAPDDLNFTKPLVYPNPFSGTFGILNYLNSPQDATVVVSDINGRITGSFTTQFQMGYNYLPVSLMQYSANGIYFVKVSTAESDRVFKIVKSD